MLKGYRNWICSVLRKAGFAAGFVLAAVVAFSFAFSSSTDAQSSSNAVSNLLNQLQQGTGQGLTLPQSLEGTTTGPNLPSSVTLQPAPLNAQQPLRPSRLEEILSLRAGTRLQQFGYEQLGRGTPVTVPQTGAIQDDYVLGPGDEIIVSLRGQENGEFRATVDRNGQVVLPRLNPTPATGRTFGSFRQDLEAAIHRAYVATNASISVGRVRQISVLVSGEVNNPGQRLVTGLSSVVDALLLSGGVKKTGSLRDVRIQRAGHEFTVDLYSVLTAQGASTPMRLADGDRVLVTPLGKTVAVAGLVRQPGIYELPPLQSSLSARSLIALSGGEEVRGRYRMSVMRIDVDGRSVLTPLTNENAIVRDSDILLVQLGADQMAGKATLAGGIGLAGSYPIVPGTKLSEVLKAPGALGTAPYSLFGIISRRNLSTLLRTLLAFTPVAVLNGSEDQSLQTDDIIHPFTDKEARLVRSTVRIYVQRRDQAQQALRDPLSTLNNSQMTQQGAPNTQSNASNLVNGQGQFASTTSLFNGQRSAAEEAQDEEADIQLIGSLSQRQLDMVTSNQVALTDFRYLPERNVDPQSQVVYLPMQYQNLEGNLNNELFPSQPTTPSAGYGQGLPVLPQGIQPNGANGQMNQPDDNGQMIQPGTFSSQNPPPPAPNFEEQPSLPGIFPTNREAPTFNALAQQLGVDPLVLVNFVIDHQVTLDGAVRGPGSYLVGPNASLKDLVEAAGGTVNWADESGVELISTAVDGRNGRSVTQRTELPLQQGLLASYVVKPHDEFRFNKVFNDADIGNVTVQGEVRFTGTYPITRGEHLSDLLARAGGLTGVAYPYGTIFLRKSAADRERDGYLRAANEVEDQLVVAMTRIGNDKIDAGTFAAMQGFVTELRTQKAVGRVSIVADPSVLASNPTLDPLLEPGDVLYIPQRPSTVAVLGQVSQPGSFPYRPGLTIADYIEQAGGYSSTSNESMTFIVLPDGSARKAQNSWLSYDSQSLPPGSTIVVPRDVTPLDTRQVILDVSSIFSQLAVSAASLAVLSTVH